MAQHMDEHAPALSMHMVVSMEAPEEHIPMSLMTHGLVPLLMQAGGNGDALEVAVPAGLTRLFKHPVLDWGLHSVNQKQLAARDVSCCIYTLMATEIQ